MTDSSAQPNFRVIVIDKAGLEEFVKPFTDPSARVCALRAPVAEPSLVQAADLSATWMGLCSASPCAGFRGRLLNSLESSVLEEELGT